MLNLFTTVVLSFQNKNPFYDDLTIVKAWIKKEERILIFKRLSIVKILFETTVDISVDMTCSVFSNIWAFFMSEKCFL